MTSRPTPPLALLVTLVALTGCGAAEPIGTADLDTTKFDPGKADTSAEAVFVIFEFDGQLVAPSVWNARSMIEDQLLYTIGHLNGDRGVGRLDRLELSDVEQQDEGDLTRVTYTARLPVAWGRRQDVPETYTLRLPVNGGSAGFQAFTDKYSHDCVDWGAHDVDSGSMWYYYRPNAFRCQLADEDIFVAEATVTPSETQTTGKFPEYDRVWADDVLRVVAVYGKYEDGAEDNDAGISGYDAFVREIRRTLADHALETVPAEVPESPGVAVPDITFRGTLADGRRVEVVALLVDNVRTAGREFDQRYSALSGKADLIVYNGHAGLGANIRALARKGRWEPGQYAIVFMNGCDTYAYVDTALWDAHAAINPDDPTGTKYVDVVTNALPSYFRSMPHATMALIRGLMAYDAPRTYEQIFSDVDSSQVVLVSGEEDNTFVPGATDPVDPPDAWAGMEDTGTVARDEERRYETPTLPAGKYLFEMTGTSDADLYVRIGEAPTAQVYDCRPYESSSNETCAVDLPAAAAIHVMVRGYAASSDFALVGRPD